MSYAFYVDPLVPDHYLPDGMQGPPAIAYLKLSDLDAAQLDQLDLSAYPTAGYTIAEIHPAQWEALRIPVDRLSIVLEKSKFPNLTSIKAKMEQGPCDITFHWDHRFHLNYYFKMLQYWIHCGATHFSFYELSSFEKWQRLKSFLTEQGFQFYDRYHACLPGLASQYQKHIARFGNLISVGGFSRVTAEDGTKIRAAGELEWTMLAPKDAAEEKLLFAFADCDGMALTDLPGMDPTRVVEAGMAVIDKDRLIPTDTGLWDTVGLVSNLQQT